MSQGYEGSDRQCRGRLLAALRDADGPVAASDLDSSWDDSGQRARALAALMADGLVVAVPGDRLALPGEMSRAAAEDRPVSRRPAD